MLPLNKTILRKLVKEYAGRSPKNLAIAAFFEDFPARCTTATAAEEVFLTGFVYGCTWMNTQARKKLMPLVVATERRRNGRTNGRTKNESQI
jgi:hypothetical protein